MSPIMRDTQPATDKSNTPHSNPRPYPFALPAGPLVAQSTRHRVSLRTAESKRSLVASHLHPFTDATVQGPLALCPLIAP